MTIRIYKSMLEDLTIYLYISLCKSAACPVSTPHKFMDSFLTESKSVSKVIPALKM